MTQTTTRGTQANGGKGRLLGPALAALVLMLAGGCSLELGDAPFKCRSSGTRCPPGYDCKEGYCVRPGSCPKVLSSCRDGGVVLPDKGTNEGGVTPDKGGPVCGNGRCETGETSSNCPVDCPTGCGNGVCDANETPTTCPQDCQQNKCGNGTCDPGETSTSCPQDCQQTCTDGDTQCQGTSSLKYCSSGAWTTDTCQNLCVAGGYGFTTGCQSGTGGKDVCVCGGNYGSPCVKGSQPCATGLQCIEFMGGSFCTKPCSNNLMECTGTPAAPAGTKAFCLLTVGSQYYCAFLCGSTSGTWSCPTGLTCDPQDNPPGSGQYACVP